MEALGGPGGRELCEAVHPLTFCPGEMRALTCFSTGFRELS